jgi:hypothetical protein
VPSPARHEWTKRISEFALGHGLKPTTKFQQLGHCTIFPLLNAKGELLLFPVKRSLLCSMARVWKKMPGLEIMRYDVRKNFGIATFAHMETP